MKTLEEFKKEQMSKFESIPRYFDRKGKPLKLLEFSRLLDDNEYRIVKQEYIGKYFVSTVWLGLNMNFLKTLPILIFETMIFMKDEKDKEIEDPINHYQDRYSTEEEALEGHQKAVKIALGEVKLHDNELDQNQ